MSKLEYEQLLRCLRRFQGAKLAHLRRTRLLRYLDEDDDVQHEQSYYSRPLPASRTYLVQVPKERADARNSSVDLLDRLLASELQAPVGVAAVTGAHRQQDQRRSGWWAWLRRLEDELLEEQGFLGPDHGGQVYSTSRREKQSTVWQRSLALKQHQSREALKLVLKFKRDEHARNKAWVAAILQRLTGSSFPRELLRLVVEATVKPTIFSFSTSQSQLLESVSKQIFTRWPEDLRVDARTLLLEETTDAILRYSFIKIPADFNSKHTIPVPQALHSKEHLLRYVSLDVYTIPHGGCFNNDLESGVESMALLKQHFPRLEVCIILLQCHQRSVSNSGRTSRMRSIKDLSIMPFLSGRDGQGHGGRSVETLEELVVKFIDTLLAQGPGKRRFIRFSHSEENSSTKWIGPLTRVSGQEPSGGLGPIPRLAVEENRFGTDAERIFQEAYWGKGGRRGDWMASYREQEV